MKRFTKIPNGMPGMEDRMRMIFHGAVAHDRLSLNRFVEVTATTPAKMFGQFPQKGTIAIGSDADIVLWDPAASHGDVGGLIPFRRGLQLLEGTEVKGNVERDPF